MSLVSAGGFLPTNSLKQIITNNTQEIFLIFSFLISIMNIYFIYNLFVEKNFLKKHYEDLMLILMSFILTLILFFSIKDLNFLHSLISVLSSLSTSGLSIGNIQENFSLYLLFLTILGGSIISNTSGIKILRIYILLKALFIEIFKLVRPNNIINHNILFSEEKINSQNIKITFLIFISFFISLFILSSVLLFDNINFENSFKLSVLTLTNTVNSSMYNMSNIEFQNLLTSSKIFLIIFMIIGKIELISVILLVKKIFFKN